MADPLAHAEQVIKGLQQQMTPAAPRQAVRPVAGQLTSGFGPRWGVFHYGDDFADPIGTPIQSVESGTVIQAGPAQGFGLWVRVKQDDGTTAVYGHVNQILVHEGQRVRTGDRSPPSATAATPPGRTCTSRSGTRRPQARPDALSGE